MMQEKANEQLRQISIEHEQRKLQLEDIERKLKTREAINESEKMKLDDEKKMVLTYCVTYGLLLNFLDYVSGLACMFANIFFI